MWAILIAMIASLTGALPPSGDYLTLEGGILCRIPDNVEIANEPSVARSETVLQAMGCLRMRAGVRSRRIDSAVSEPDGDAWQVLILDPHVPFTVLWGLPAAFTRPDAHAKTVTPNPRF